MLIWKRRKCVKITQSKETKPRRDKMVKSLRSSYKSESELPHCEITDREFEFGRYTLLH